ncbi:MAG: FG-GAP repeat protein, partial [Bdellovibrionales bacterium]|nr:FG-GAP repeat protein [Bdellovibrionales bacterium]
MGRINFPTKEFHTLSFSILFSCAFFIAQSQAQQPELAVIKGNPDDQLGRAIATADVDGDGYLDFIVGAPLAKVDKAEQGSVAIYSGDDFEEIGKRIGSSKGSMAGFAIANA